jgi:hypothetical protein
MLDTSILIDLIKNLPPAIAQRVDSLAEDALLCMSFVTWADLSRASIAAQEGRKSFAGCMPWPDKWRCCIRRAPLSASTMLSSSRV